jgi:beta-glucanase (GH16 family)
MEARGNAPSYLAQGRDVVSSSLRYGPLPSLTHTLFGWLSSRHDPFDHGFHTYALEWTDSFMRFYVDSRIRQTLHLTTRSDKQSFWSRARFPRVAVNGTDGPVVGVADPWVQGGWNAPFDRRQFVRPIIVSMLTHTHTHTHVAFYLVLNLAVGGTSGWFPDGVGGKPWQDQSQSESLGF